MSWGKFVEEWHIPFDFVDFFKLKSNPWSKKKCLVAKTNIEKKTQRQGRDGAPRQEERRGTVSGGQTGHRVRTDGVSRQDRGGTV